MKNSWKAEACFSLATQVRAQTQKFLFHRENGLDAGISASASISIKVFSFSL